jgi:hypothetical protein
VPYEIPDFRVGKQVRSGQPAPTEPFAVTVFSRDEAMEFFNCRNGAELARHLRGLRDLGLLVHNRGRLTQRIRIGPREQVAAYVCRGRAADLPKRKRRRQRVYAA